MNQASHGATASQPLEIGPIYAINACRRFGPGPFAEACDVEVAHRQALPSRCTSHQGQSLAHLSWPRLELLLIADNLAMQFERVDDSELLTLLEGAPAAIVEWPDGSRTLMVVENN